MANDYSKIKFRYKTQSVYFLKDTQAPDYITEKIEAEKNFYEIDLLSWLEKQDIPPGDFVDVGANIGNHSLFFTKIMKRTTWSFEPYSPAFQLLKENLTANKLDISRIFQFGLSSTNTKANIILPDNNNIGAAKVSIDSTSGIVELKRGDEVLADIQKISLMKVDVEGHELDVVKGCLNIIKKHHPLLLIECMNAEEYNKIDTYVEPLGYVPCAVFGATPMIIFKHYNNAPKDMGDAVNEILHRYFELDGRFVSARDLHRKYAKELRILRGSNEALRTKNGNLIRYYSKYKAIKSSRSYRIGLILTLPIRKLKVLAENRRG